MPIATRQTNLLVAEDWTVVYKAFQQVNFTSYDFDSIRTALVEYIRINFPEDFNDWIESSEFVAIIDLIAYLGQSLAFRMDLNTRENFLDTAESRESVLRLARMLSYTPQRNYPAFGLVKITGVQTDEPVIDSENRNLSGINVEWNSVTNPDWLEQFTLILNSAFNSNNQFGNPVKDGSINSIPTELYELNNIRGVSVVYPFNISVSGRTVGCEVVSSDFTDGETIEEFEPDPYSAFRILYRNDGAGNSSPSTGFFMAFKQGQLQFQDVNLGIPVENRLINIDIANINESDVFFQEIDTNGQITTNWTRVPTVAPSSNIIFNAIDRSERDIFTVITREDDKISLRFADGRFGNIPQGNYRIWYRTSNGLRYQIRPQDLQNFSVTIPYQNLSGQNFNLTITYSLQETVSNSVPRESIRSIKERAPDVYYTQDRMVNGKDYNVFPLIKSGQALKVKAVNRSYSGHSRFININDPTGTFQNTNVFSDDGIFYKQFDTDLTEISISSSLTNREIISNSIEPTISSTEMKNFIYDQGIRSTDYNLEDSTQYVVWRTSTQIAGGSTGFFEQNNLTVLVGTNQSDPFNLITEDALVHLVPIASPTSDGIWVKIVSLTSNGNGNNADGSGTITIDERIDDSLFIIKEVFPSFSRDFSDAEVTEIESQMNLRNTFGLGFNYVDKSWYIIETQDLADLDSDYDLTFAENTSGNNLDASWLVRVEYGATTWRIYSRGLQYIWESLKDVRFFFSNDYRAVDIETGLALQDEIRILKTNSQPDSNEPLEEELKLALDSTFIYPDGFIEPRRVKVTTFDTDQDGTPDDPIIFEKVQGNEVSYIFWEIVTSVDGYENQVPVTVQFQRTSIPTSGDPQNPVDGDLAFVFDQNDTTVGQFFEYDSDTDTWSDVSDSYTFNAFGRGSLSFQWKHFVSREDRIDPALTNVIDIFVLTNSYDSEIRAWIKSDGSIEEMPEEPTSEELRNTFTDLEDFKTVSDQLVWRPTRYKVLFGDQAAEDLRARFKVVKVPGASVSDNEIKSRIIEAFDEFFEVQNWDFGETFFFTELAAFVHQRLATLVASIVLVPTNVESAFGNLYQVKVEFDEIPIHSAKVTDIDIVENLTVRELRIGN